MGTFDTIIRGGRVATASDTVVCDIGICAGRIDSHVHFAQPSGPIPYSRQADP